MLGTARWYSMLFDGNQKCWESNRAFLLLKVFIWRHSFEFYAMYAMLFDGDSVGHSAGAHETLEMLGGMLDSFDHTEQSSTEQG